MRTTFLHLSDLHFLPKSEENYGLVITQLFEDLRVQLAGSTSVFLIFSGDFVKAGSKKELFDAVFERFDSELASIGIPQHSRIIVPGNHDVSQEELNPFVTMQKGCLNEITEEIQFNNNLPQLTNSFLQQKFKNYFEFEKQFSNILSTPESVGGAGRSLQNNIGVYCLNSALCSFAGLKDSSGAPINDFGKLMIDTRSLHRWIAEDKSQVRILVMHHPLEWLAPWAKSELEKIISKSFSAVFSGHIHTAIPEFHSRGYGGVVTISAPPLFTKKSDRLGYSIVTIESVEKKIDILYREWAPTNTFVLGTTFAGNDSGKVTFRPGIGNDEAIPAPLHYTANLNTETSLQKEFSDACEFYSAKRNIWVDRDFSLAPETALKDSDTAILRQKDITEKIASCVIRAPRQFGLTCLGKKIALDRFLAAGKKNLLLNIDSIETTHNREELRGAIEIRCKNLNASSSIIEGYIIDNWLPDKHGRKLVAALQQLTPNAIFIILHSIDDCTQIADAFNEAEGDLTLALPRYYLLSLNRSRIRELVSRYLEGSSNLDDELVTRRVITDIDALNIHRTPLNCLLLLKLTEQAFDENPINRTEVIGRVLYLLFFQFNKIPTYASRPDLKDCEYALGFFGEWLLREKKRAFTKRDFYAKVDEYCQKQLLQLDVDVLFAFLFGEHIFIKKGDTFEFRFAYWLHYFAAHRMHHDKLFASFILSDRRYASYPELIEFYAGIDRRRTDAIETVTADLRKMSNDFLERTGISPDFNPQKEAQWTPDATALEALRKEIEEGFSSSSIPISVKDAVADTHYNSAKPYNQELARFMEESTLAQLVSAMRGAARVLRNSDHVDPAAKSALLREVIACWTRVSQILVVLSPVLAKQKSVAFEGMNFALDKTFNHLDTPEKRWHALMNSIIKNVVDWYHEDLFSSKMGPLFSNYIGSATGSLGELLLLVTMVIQKPVGWENEIEKFIVREGKNSFYLSRVFGALRAEYRFGTPTERARQQLRRLAAMAIAKHTTGVKHPDIALVESAAKRIIDGKSASQKSKFF